MALRSITSIVTFPQLFCLVRISARAACGEYEVLVEEELIEPLSFTAYPERRFT
ncbi:hypothetical protein [Leisingera sp.]|uniref:hypothetical protein n=1 Tax=Leisingera sp. TaxID=1879318 RepID=UPI002B267B6A|nr:hypothetical protein [Leisingera sp.]